MTFSLWFFTSISNCNLKYIQGFVCFYCQKIILLQNLPGALEYSERMISENVCRFNFTSPSWDIFCVRSRYLLIGWLFNRLFWCFSCYSMFAYKKRAFLLLSLKLKLLRINTLILYCISIRINTLILYVNFILMELMNEVDEV